MPTASKTQTEQAAQPEQQDDTTTTYYRYVGPHAKEVQLSDGTRPQVGPGDYITMSVADFANSENEALVPYLIDASSIQGSEAQAEAAAPKIEKPETPTEEPAQEGGK